MADVRAHGACSGAERPTVRREPAEHREHVVRRLLARGLSPYVLLALLPDFRSVVARVVNRE